MYQYRFSGFKELADAIKRNPQVVKDELGFFLPRAIATYKSIMQNNPWRIGMKGGGVPVDTRNLADTHQTEIKSWEARIFPIAPYASYVHGDGDKSFNIRGVQLRPWLDYAMDRGQLAVDKLADDLLNNIVVKLAE